jgi:hypothetical protein
MGEGKSSGLAIKYAAISHNVSQKINMPIRPTHLLMIVFFNHRELFCIDNDIT